MPENFCLQCGRIHKDAEMSLSNQTAVDDPFTFNVAASIKMRKSFMSVYLLSITFSTFNVAASIKMRKSNAADIQGFSAPVLQCGRIHKDAEIYVLILGE